MGGFTPECLYDTVSVRLWPQLYEELMDNSVRLYGFMLMILACEGLCSGSDGRFIWGKVSSGFTAGRESRK